MARFTLLAGGAQSGAVKRFALPARHRQWASGDGGSRVRFAVRVERGYRGLGDLLLESKTQQSPERPCVIKMSHSTGALSGVGTMGFV
jgi:hypothetical protein